MTFGRKLQWDLNRALELLNQGKTCREIAEIMHLKREQVYDALRCRGFKIIPDRRGFRPRWDMDRAKHLADQGKAIYEIAQIMNLPQDLIRSGFKNRGWRPLNTRSGRHVTWDVGTAKQLRQQGLKWVEIDKKLGLSPGTVRHHFVRHNLHNPRPTPNMRWDLERAINLWQKGFRWKEIGDLVGTHGNNVRRALARRGLLGANGSSHPG